MLRLNSIIFHLVDHIYESSTNSLIYSLIKLYHNCILKKEEIIIVKIDLIELCPMEDSNFLCAVVVARYKGKWLFVREKGKETWELPGGTHENNENIICTASRELFEETGAIKYTLIPICITSVNIDGHKSYGQLFYSEISELGELPDSEIEEVKLFENLPKNLTYPSIHSVLFNKVAELCSNYDKMRIEYGDFIK